jgi:hypothetical protein
MGLGNSFGWRLAAIESSSDYQNKSNPKGNPRGGCSWKLIIIVIIVGIVLLFILSR